MPGSFGGKIGKTEAIQNSNDPHFAKSFEIDYFFEEKQTMHFKVMDHDFGNTADDFIGEVTCTVGEIVGASGGALVKVERLT